MANKANNPMKGQPEVSASGVTPKSQRGIKKPTHSGVVVINKHARRGKHWLRTFVSSVLITDLVFGMVLIYDAGLPGDMPIHAMWAFGVAHIAALGVTQFVNKLE